MGDFNLPDIDWDYYLGSSEISNKFVSMCNELGMTQYVNVPTRDSHILDLVLATVDNSVFNVEVDAPFSYSDHCIIYFKLLFFKSKKGKQAKKIKLYSNADYDLIIAFLMTVDWASIFMSNRDIDSAWSSFDGILAYIINQFIPEKTVSEVHHHKGSKRAKKLYRVKSQKFKKFTQCKSAC